MGETAGKTHQRKQDLFEDAIVKTDAVYARLSFERKGTGRAGRTARCLRALAALGKEQNSVANAHVGQLTTDGTLWPPEVLRSARMSKHKCYQHTNLIAPGRNLISTRSL